MFKRLRDTFLSLFFRVLVIYDYENKALSYTFIAVFLINERLGVLGLQQKR